MLKNITECMNNTIINKIDVQKIGLEPNVDLRILREDLFPFYGGGNKARKLTNIIHEIKSGGHDAVVTTGSIYSNHCRATALMCSNNDLNLTLILHGSKEQFHKTAGNSKIIRATDTKIVFCEPDRIAETMDNEMNQLKAVGFRPYYLYGGGHNIKGVEAYIQLMPELKEYFKKAEWEPDYIFLPSGTGSTQAGLIIGSIKNGMDCKIVGISIARNKIKGVNSIMEIFEWFKLDITFFKHLVYFDDNYLAGGYGLHNKSILELSSKILKSESLLLDPTYTAKALWGTINYITTNCIKGKVLFINTGGPFNYFI